MRRYALVALVAFLAALAGVAAARLATAPRAAGESELHALLHNGLRLDAAQQRRVAALERDFAQRRAALDEAMRAQNRVLARAIAAEHGYGPRVAAAVDRSHQVMGEVQKETLKHVFAMRGVLRADQAARYDAAVVRTLTAPSR
ncbi:periplasmic heavy metal sensor [Sphingomonas corticis]|jgi:ABC-type amino acid transport substrate-binding protein|uniref:Periplasmic heavy metal sensor n=1 Tax=Sphingomonas corticis TaxID=2722791 RepID=A0ABX1CPB6_9SPHN|nr:periplasmic heavy metal sensor [Sphingomonas corticis]NJR79096.1 periplasmic heavy metal sensor [Sphingomonas corticis]